MRSIVKLIISGGGTGGHVYPALTVVAALKQQQPDLQLRWVGSIGGMEAELVERAGLTFESIAAAGLRGRNPLAALKGLLTLARGYGQSRRIIRQFRPDALFVTGGTCAFPLLWRPGRPVFRL